MAVIEIGERMSKGTNAGGPHRWARQGEVAGSACEEAAHLSIKLLLRHKLC